MGPAVNAKQTEEGVLNGTIHLHDAIVADNTLTIFGELTESTSFEPGSYDYPTKVEVTGGEGIFFLTGKNYPYRRGSVFLIPAGARHSFLWVRIATNFIKQFPRPNHPNPADWSPDI